MARLASWCFRHRLAVFAGWGALVVTLVALTGLLGSRYNDSVSLPGTESSQAMALLEQAFPHQSGDGDQIVWHTSRGPVSEPAVQARMTTMLAQVARSADVASVTSPYTAAGAAQVSRDSQTAYATVTFTRPAGALPAAAVSRVIALAQSARAPGLQVDLAGSAVETSNQTPPASSEAVGLLAAGVILLVAFGSLFAMATPLLVAVVSIGSALLTVGLASHLMALNSISPTLAALIGLGVGIDYALFVVTRHRAGIRAGLAPHDAAVRSLDTAGRAVLFAGATVCVAMLGLLVLRVQLLTGMGVAAALAVVFTMAATVTLLPALLGTLGTRVLSRRERRQLAADGPHVEGSSGVWARWAAFVDRHPVWLASAALAVVVLLAVPVASLRLGLSDAGTDPATSTTRGAYDLLAGGFGAGTNGPLELVAQTPRPDDRAALTRLVTTLATTPDVAGVVAAPTRAGAPVAVVTVIPRSGPTDPGTATLITHLRAAVIPAAEQGSTLRVFVGGSTAVGIDFASVISNQLPLFVAVIVALGFGLLLVAFRSLAVPATAAAMNLLAAGASLGVVVAVFGWGWGAGALGLGGAGPVEAFLPVIMLAILFGLSMDYQVFLVSRMHEEWVHTGDNRRAVIVGQATTGRVITAAAAIMVCVFTAFVFGGQRVIAEFGVGLSAAVLIDAFVIRTVLVPAAMHVFGAGNWWLPRWLDARLPHLTVDPPDDPLGVDEAPEGLDEPVVAAR